MGFSSFLKKLFAADPPGQLQGLHERVSAAVSSAPHGTLICALESHYLPHGGRDEMCVTLSPGGGRIVRTRSPEDGEKLELSRRCEADEALRIREALKEMGAWRLGDNHAPIIDGWRCTICLAEGEILHVIGMNVTTGEHRRLIQYLCGLLPTDEDRYGHLTDVFTDDAP